MRIEYLADNIQYIPILGRSFYNEWGYLKPSTSIKYYETKLKNSINRNVLPIAFVAMLKDTLMGTISLVKYEMDSLTDITPCIASLYILPEHRKKGVSKLLINHVIEKVKELQYSTIYLFTVDKESFYNKYGWSTLENIKYHDQRVVIMSKKLFYLTHNQFTMFNSLDSN